MQNKHLGIIGVKHFSLLNQFSQFPEPKYILCFRAYTNIKKRTYLQTRQQVCCVYLGKGIRCLETNGQMKCVPTVDLYT